MGQMTISNGTVIMATVVVGNNNSNPGMLTVAGAAIPVMTVLSSLIVGDCGLGNVGMVTVAGGNLFVTNAAHNATLDVRDGTFIVSSGLVMVDKLVVTSACARVVHTGGGLIYSQLVLDPNQSTVNDGIPNGWKQQYGLDPFDPNVGNEGADGTGMNNLQKYLAGFAPNNSAAYPHIISLARQGANMNVAYRGANGDSTYLPGIASRTNVLEFTAGTGGGNFPNSPLYTGIQTNILSGGTGLGVVTNTIDSGGATNTPSRFYRYACWCRRTLNLPRSSAGSCSCSADFGGVSFGNRKAMSNTSPSVKAEILRSTIPAWAKDKILKNVFCVQRRTSVAIVDYSKKERRGDVILKGRCGVCGHTVVRVVETSEAPPPNN